MLTLGQHAFSSSYEAVPAHFFTASRVQGAEVLIGTLSTIKLYASSESGQTAFDRAEQICANINALRKAGYSIGSVEAFESGGVASGMVNGAVVFTVDRNDVKHTNMPTLLLAYDWANRLRRAFGAPLLGQDQINQTIKIERLKGVRIEVRDNIESGISEVVINGKVVMRMHEVLDGKTSYDRAMEIAQAIEQSIIEGGAGVDVKPGLHPNNKFSIKIGENVISAIPEDEAVINNTKLWDMAYFWTNKIRGALGAAPISADSIKSSLTQVGKASWYGPYFHGRRASSGERYNMYEFTGAHKTLPFGSEVLVTDLDTNKSIVVRITDRGPYIRGRIIDLSKSAAEALGMIGKGVARVRIDLIGTSEINNLRKKARKGR